MTSSTEWVNVLVVSDRTASAEPLLGALASAPWPHFAVNLVSDASLAGELIEREPPDVIFLDLVASQPDAVRALRSRAAGVAVVALADTGDEQASQALSSAGAHDVLACASEGLHQLLPRSIMFALARAQADQAAQRLEEVMDSSDDAIIGHTVDGIVLSWNASAQRIYGFDADEVIGKPLWRLAPTEAVAEELAQTLSGITRGAPIEDFETTARRRDGNVIAISAAVLPIRDQHGRVTGGRTVARDITERRRAEQERELAIAELATAQRIAGIGSWWIDQAHNEQRWSRELYRLLDQDPDDGALDRAELIQRLHPADRDGVAAAFEEAFEPGGVLDVTFRLITRDREERTLHSIGRADPENPGCLMGTVQDVTELRAAERAARAAERRFRDVFDTSPIGMALRGTDGLYTDVNQALCEIVGYSRGELAAMSDAAITHPDDVAEDRRQVARLLAGELDRYHREKRYVRASGDAVWVSLHSSVLHDSEGRPYQVLNQVVDITAQRRLEDRLRYLADHDPLTGLLNRRRFHAELDRHITEVKRYGDRGALLILDLDQFKLVNDTFGHAAGDRLLVSVAELLRRRLRASDRAGRLGGDEFAILLPIADADSARSAARGVAEKIREHSIALGADAPTRITSSIGVALLHQGLEGADEALIEADLAMYEAKQGGRDRIELFTSALGSKRRGRAS